MQSSMGKQAIDQPSSIHSPLRYCSANEVIQFPSHALSLLISSLLFLYQVCGWFCYSSQITNAQLFKPGPCRGCWPLLLKKQLEETQPELRHCSFSQEGSGSRSGLSLTSCQEALRICAQCPEKLTMCSFQYMEEISQHRLLGYHVPRQRTGLILISRWRGFGENHLLLISDYLGCLIGPQSQISSHHLSICHFTFTPLWLLGSSIKIKILLGDKLKFYWILPNIIERN